MTLNPGTRAYDVELTLAHGLVRDPASAGMRHVQIKELTGLGQAAFSESGYAVQQKQNIEYVVWRSSSHVWVLPLADAGQTNASHRLVPLAERISSRLPQA